MIAFLKKPSISQTSSVIALIFVLSLPLSAQIRMGVLIGQDVGWSGCTDVMTAKLDYMRTLGNTHVLFPTMALTFNPVGNLEPWCTPAARVAEMRRMVNSIVSRNMIPVPAITSFSHMDAFNGVTKQPWGNGSLVPPRSCTPWNDACEAFNTILGDIQTVWTSTQGLAPRPVFIHIGHDEYLPLPPAGTTGPTAAQAAEEMAARVAQIDARWPQSAGVPAVSVGIFGDSFLPNDNGELLGWVGNPVTGADGALDILTRSTGWNVDRNRLILMPWAYGANEAWLGGAQRPDLPAGILNNRFGQVQYLHNLGIPFVIATGEHGLPTCDSHESVLSLQVVDFHKRVFFEWVEAVNRVGSPSFRGYSSHIFSVFQQNGAGTQVGYLMPFLNHAFAYPDSYRGSYWAGFYTSFDYVGSRQTVSWNPWMLGQPLRLSTYLSIIRNSL